MLQESKQAQHTHTHTHVCTYTLIHKAGALICHDRIIIINYFRNCAENKSSSHTEGYPECALFHTSFIFTLPKPPSTWNEVEGDAS